MSGFSESSTVQAAILGLLAKADLGWKYIPGDFLPRTTDDVLLESEVVAALVRLNPVIAENPDRVNEILPGLRALILSVAGEGLVESNERMVEWLRGLHTHRFVGTPDYVPVRLVDFDSPRTNNLVVSDEVTFHGLDVRRFDIVLWVNGIPLVVGETKTPVKMQTSWLDAAKDVADVYERKAAGFFVPNVFSFGTDGREYHYGAVGQAAEKWLPWGHTGDPLDPVPLRGVLRSVELMLSPESVLEILRDFTLFASVRVGPVTIRVKIIPRYPQVEGVRAIVARAKDPARRRGLLWHHQGSGKTYLMAFAVVRLLRDPVLDGPTVLVVLDRLDLIEQVTAEFRSAGIPRVSVAETKDDLRRALAEDARGVIITTIFRFHEPGGVLNDRSNIIVLVDEAHRTQEGRLGVEMRLALPNARFFGLTGTPVSDADRNTFEAFGDPDDPGHVMNHYSMERSIRDGATLPVHVETRLVDFHLDRAGLDEAFAALAEEEGLTDEQRDLLIRRAGSVPAFLKDPDRIAAVCRDIVDHWAQKMAPLGLKAQVVAYDRELCVAYEAEIRRLLAARAAAEGDGAPEVAVVMTVGTKKDEPKEWSRYELTREEEKELKDRFKDVHDPLAFLVVTAKLLTGFDAPIEGVMYLDKPLRAHTLFQAITRTNRRWTNPITSQEKRFGLVVDYVGVGEEIARALQAASPEGGKRPLVGVEELVAELQTAVADALVPFEGIDRADAGFAALLEAQGRIEDPEARDVFAEDFVRAEALWEFLYYHPLLAGVEDDYRWLAKVYASVQPATGSNALLWHRLGAKTLDLVHTAITDVRVGTGGLEEVVVDEEIIGVIRELRLPGVDTDPHGPLTVQEALDTIEARIAHRLAGPAAHPVWQTLSERLEALRRARLARAEDSVEFLKRLLELARLVLAADKAEREGSLDEFESALPDPNKGALTQILREYAPEATPEIIERVVADIDAIVAQVRGTGWQTSHPADRQVRQEIRKALKKYGLPPAGELFNRAYAYVAENY